MRGRKLFDKVSRSEASEFYTPIPKGYRRGRTKFVVITGSVISGIGKGTVTSTLCKLLADRGLNVEPNKLEAYLNVDAGTMSPYRHGEVFVLDDGAETDMDLGSYERFLDKNLSEENFTTSGKIYKRVIEKERAGKYLGRDVQFIPHVTGENKLVLRELAVKKKADVVLTEIGGTIGDYENTFALEAIRELIYEEGRQNVCVVNVTYVIEPQSLGEFKSKAAQQGIRRLMSMGLQPDVIVVRSHSKIPRAVKEKISISSNVPVENVIGLEDVEKIHEIPLIARRRGLDELILRRLGLAKKYPSNGNARLKAWTRKLRPRPGAPAVHIAIAGKYVNVADAYISILKALEHCEGPANVNVKVVWVDAEAIEKGDRKEKAKLYKVDGVIVPIGFGARGAEGKIAAARYCREKKVPYLGLCFGFQMAIVEFARHVCRLKGAHSTEVDPKTPHPVVDLLPEQKKLEGLGGNMRLGGHEVEIRKGTLAYRLHKTTRIRRRFRHRWECNPQYIPVLEKHGMVFSGKAPHHPIMQILELPGHPFFMATQYHPEYTSRPLKPDPLYLAFVKAARAFARKRKGGERAHHGQH